MNAQNKPVNKKAVKNLTASAVCLALCMLLPFLTGGIPQIGARIAPMHIPVLLCGFIAGPYYAAIVGFIAPPLRFILFGMPPILPTGVAMSFELAVYGALSGLLYKMLPKKTINIYISLIGAMLAGRIVWGIVRFAMSALRIVPMPFTMEMFIAGAFVTALPGIIIHIILIPLIVIALKRSNLLVE